MTLLHLHLHAKKMVFFYHFYKQIKLIANLMLMVIQKRIKRSWSFSGLATMMRIMLMYYVNCYTFLEDPERDWSLMMDAKDDSPPELSLF